MLFLRTGEEEEKRRKSPPLGDRLVMLGVCCGQTVQEHGSSSCDMYATMTFLPLSFLCNSHQGTPLLLQYSSCL